MDTISPSQRSANMSRIRGRNTAPELIVRKLAHSLGYRFRLHLRELPGSPDLVFRSRKKVIFVNGCFWHRHEGCRYAYKPKSNVQSWENKFSSNVERDNRVTSELKNLGWRVLVIWECETTGNESLVTKLQGYIGNVLD